ncbi:hypothetical protein ABZ532_28050 [Streptomyces sp. NPDC019396]|uniref:hypothetical protein n=1 Tax=Streptomyces sp. NPDC019396 TaxID=3154687 RepID=UPI0033CBB75C
MVTAREACDGVFTGEAATGLESLMGEKRFQSVPKGGVAGLAESLIDDARVVTVEGTTDRVDFCHMTLPEANRYAITLGMYLKAQYAAWPPRESPSPSPASPSPSVKPTREQREPSPSLSVERFQLGREEAWVTSLGSRVTFKCSSPRLSGSMSLPILVTGELMNRHPRNFTDISKADSEATLLVLHAATLAVAKELRCKDNGGLPEKATPFKRLPPPPES